MAVLLLLLLLLLCVAPVSECGTASMACVTLKQVSSPQSVRVLSATSTLELLAGREVGLGVEEWRQCAPVGFSRG